MANKEIDDLTAGTDPKAALFHGVQGGNSRKFVGDVVAHQFRGARVRMNADDTAQNVTAADTEISFDVADFDTDTFWSAGSPTRLTIPAGLGITHVELTGQVHVSSSTNATYSQGVIDHFNSSDTLLKAMGQRFVEKGATAIVINVSTGPVAVSDGDYFTLMVREESDTSVTIEGDNLNETYLAIKVVGMEPV